MKNIIASLFDVLIPIFCILVVLQITSLYRNDGKQRKFWKWLEFDTAELGTSNLRLLAIASIFGLFLEMMLIRWVSSEVRIFAYFKNFVLVACFLGFGLGCCLCRKKINLAAMLAPIAVLTFILTVWEPYIHPSITRLPELLGSSADVNIWGVPEQPTSWAALLLAIGMVVPLFSVISITFVPVGQMVGYFLEKSREGITAYTVNVIASLAGIALYTLLCFAYQPPAMWFAIGGLAAILLTWKLPRIALSCALVFALATGLLMIKPRGNTQVYWSPYQKLAITPVISNGEVRLYSLYTNDSWYQRIVNLSPAFVAAHPADFPDGARWNPYNVPYSFYPNPPSVLVLGAGMGNDVAAALRNGSGKVTAVEIDPMIYRLGTRLHFERPYQDPRTHVVIDDARSYIQNSNEKFDLIVFSLLDSHTTTSHFTNIRIDNYVYTVEAMQAAKKLLKPGGLFIVKFQVNTSWIAGRLNGILTQVFGTAPLHFDVSGEAYGTGGRFFVTGDPQRVALALHDPQIADFAQRNRSFDAAETTLTTDDWPYLYQHAPGLPMSVILVSISVVLVFWWFIRHLGGNTGSFEWHFFFLGAGFMLLEAQIVSKMALLFGTTWVVNSIVVAGLLILIVAANLVHKHLPLSPKVAYAGLFLTIAVGFFLPLERLFFTSLLLKGLISTLLLCSPVFFAGLIFVASFERANFEGRVLGANLFGSLAGGLLESLSMWFGLKSLLVVAAALYLASAFTRKRQVGSAPNSVTSTVKLDVAELVGAGK